MSDTLASVATAQGTGLQSPGSDTNSAYIQESYRTAGNKKAILNKQEDLPSYLLG